MSAVSLALFITTITLWPLSYRAYSRLQYTSTARIGSGLSANFFLVNLSCGGIQFEYQNRTATRTAGQIANLASWSRPLGLCGYRWHDQADVQYPRIDLVRNGSGFRAAISSLGIGWTRFADDDPRCITGSFSNDIFTFPVGALAILFLVAPLSQLARRLVGRVRPSDIVPPGRPCGRGFRVSV